MSNLTPLLTKLSQKGVHRVVFLSHPLNPDLYSPVFLQHLLLQLILVILEILGFS